MSRIGHRAWLAAVAFGLTDALGHHAETLAGAIDSFSSALVDQ
jgi:hypothetical protein